MNEFETSIEVGRSVKSYNNDDNVNIVRLPLAIVLLTTSIMNETMEHIMGEKQVCFQERMRER